jgi:hypothetical protein
VLDRLLTVEEAADRLGTSVCALCAGLSPSGGSPTSRSAGMCVWTRAMWRRSSLPAGLKFTPRQWLFSPAAGPPLAVLR